MADSVSVITAGPEQARAASPETFVWVSANAGSGKTHVLVDRLARLLLGGTPPGRILCLTFTKAAAAEMINRLFGRLAGWALADEKTLCAVLKGLTGQPPQRPDLIRARQLFALALDSPGGLKIHTIHAFCTRVLHRFPLEANVAPNFTQIDDHGQAEILADIRDRIMVQAAQSPKGELAAALGTVSLQLHDMALGDLFAQFLNRTSLHAAIDTDSGVDAGIEALAAMFGALPDERSQDEIVARHFGPGFDFRIAREAAKHLQTGSTRDTELAPAMVALADSTTLAQALMAHEHVFLTNDKVRTRRKPRSRVMTKALRKDRPEIADWIDAETDRAAELQRALGIAQTLEATRACLVLGHHVAAAYEAVKRRDTLLDYDDLITKTRQLLSQGEDAQWVLFKLDGGIDHILVDEAQDTSSEQWDIVRHLAEDMMSGQSAQVAGRTVFAVGDEKQSIFSFQGADPEMFDRMRDYFAGRVKAADLLWDAVPLEASYRSTPEILSAVDAVFAAENAARGLSAAKAAVHHTATRSAFGMVELWPTAKTDKAAKPDPWTVPVDHIHPGNAQLVLAQEIAEEIANWLGAGTILPPQGRPIRPGDIMILVRRRNAFVDAMVRELKVRGVPVAGVDRMQLTEQIIVADLMALGRFSVLPEDDLTLAALLKSPLVGLTEAELFDIAFDRETSLWRALNLRAENENQPRLIAARDTLSEILNRAGRVPPFEFYALFLANPGRREAIHKRLGIEADDPIDEFLSAALDYERQETATLDGFLAWLDRGTMEIKRDMDHGRNEVRVMTVHGAKGLEANIVILPDTCSVPNGGGGFALHDVQIEGSDFSIPVWNRAPRGVIPSIDQARDAKAEREAAEYRRLLYVAMTRACDWLIVTGYEAENRPGPPAGCWYDLVREGLTTHFQGRAEDAGAGRTRYVLGPEKAPQQPGPEANDPAGVVEGITPPPWALTVPTGLAPSLRLTPSALTDVNSGQIGAKKTETDALAFLSPLTETSERRFRRGYLIHGLLEHLPAQPPADRADIASRYLATVASDLNENLRAELAAEALSVLNAPEFRPFLDPGARPEVPFSAILAGPGGQQITVEGKVDRLALIGTTLHIVDYKTHRPAASTCDDVPAGMLRQMALYRAALEKVFKPENTKVSILWTNHATLMALEPASLDRALEEALAGVPVP